MTIRLAVNLGYWGLNLVTDKTSSDKASSVVGEIERLGYDSVWVAEAYGSDAPSVLGHLAATTTTIGLGAAVFQVPARPPVTAAMTAATIDRLSRGRFRLGLGLSSPQVAEGWYGQPFAQPLTRLEDYVAVVRRALSGERVIHDGKTLRLPLPASGGKALKMMIASEQESIPIYLAGLGPQMLRLVGRIADGWLAAFFCPEHSSVLLDQVRAGAGSTGRDLTGFEVCPTVSLWIDDDHTAAQDRMRHSLALYVGGMGSRHHNVYADLVRAYGFEECADKVQELYLAGRKREAAAALPGGLIDLVTLCGPAAAVRDRLDAFAEAGVTTVLLSPATTNPEQFIDQLRKVSEVA